MTVNSVRGIVNAARLQYNLTHQKTRVTSHLRILGCHEVPSLPRTNSQANSLATPIEGSAVTSTNRGELSLEAPAPTTSLAERHFHLQLFFSRNWPMKQPRDLFTRSLFPFS